MTTRDPRSPRAPLRTETGRSEAAREPTQSLQLDISGVPEGDRDSHPSLAMGTSEASREERTKIESPSGRNKTPQPRAATKPPPVPPSRPDDPENRIGTTLGAYKITELLGKGGMGYVYRAEHVKLGREVAVKLLRGDYAKRRDAVLRFFQEAKTVNRVRHRNIVDVTDFVELDDGTTFIIMEFLRGQSLGKWARTGIDMPRALAVLVQICDGLGAAHAVGVVHRDLKPDNVVVVPTSDGAELVKLLDFGVAKLLNRDDHEDIGFQTAAGSVIGTPAYMSPEQAGGMVVDHRSDIYSLGAIMYELFCGQPMFRGRSFGEYVRKHLTEIPVPPRQTPNGSAIEPALEALILKCLAKDPNERFSHILELRDGLLHLLGGFDTHPPSYASLAHSSIRPPMTASLTQLPAGVPLPPPMMTTSPTPPSVHISHISQQPPMGYTGVGSAPSIYSQYPVHETMPPPEAATPWWVWFVGGAFAVGLGIAGALWYASSTEPPPEPAPVAQPVSHPTAAPIEPAPAATKLVELRFDSLPSAGVYADGRSAELCRTPCRFNVDLSDGGPTDRRAFVVRADGYQDYRVDVDFMKSERDFTVSLVKLPTVVTPPPPVDETEVVDMTDEPVSDEPVSDEHAEKTNAKKTGGKKAAGKDKKVEEAKVEEPKVEDKKPVVDDTKLESNEKKPEDKKKPVGPIDPTDTIDPFRRKK